MRGARGLFRRVYCVVLQCYAAVFAADSAGLPFPGQKKPLLGVLPALLRGRAAGWVKNFSQCIQLTDSEVTWWGGGNLKKYFGGMENGCIFASAFDEKRIC